MPLQLSGSLVLSGSVTSTTSNYTVAYADMQFGHVSGTRSFFAGVGIPVTASSFGAGVTNGHITLSPTASAPDPTYLAFTTFAPLSTNCTIVGYRMYTNISGSDFPQYDYNPNGAKISYVSIGTAYLTGPNSSTSGQPIQELMYSLTSGSYDYADGNWSTFTPGAILNNPPEILDAGTLYLTSSTANVNITATPYSPAYFTFLMSMGAAFATKTYKFRFELIIQAN